MPQGDIGMENRNSIPCPRRLPRTGNPPEPLELHKARFGSFYSKEYTNQYDGHQVRNMMIKVCALALIHFFFI